MLTPTLRYRIETPRSLLTVKEVASLLRISTRTVYKRQKELGAFKPAGIGLLRFDPEEINGILLGPKAEALAIPIQAHRDQIHRKRLQDKRDSEEAEAAHRKELKTSPPPTETPTAFSVFAKQYLQYAERKFVKDVFKRKFNTFNKFIKSEGDLPIDQYAPIHIHNYLNTLPPTTPTMNIGRNFHPFLHGLRKWTLTSFNSW